MTPKATLANAQKRPRGRPCEFNRETALHAAMLMFWRFGYDGTSLADLTQAMDISKPTLYAAFGDKANLFREAVVAYTALRAEEYLAALSLPTAREVADSWLRLTGGVTRDPGAPCGCFTVQGALIGSADTQRLRDELASIRLQGTTQLRERFQRAHDEGDLPHEIDPVILAEYLASLAAGMAVQSASGISPQQLNHVIDMAMASWPSSPGQCQAATYSSGA